MLGDFSTEPGDAFAALSARERRRGRVAALRLTLLVPAVRASRIDLLRAMAE